MNAHTSSQRNIYASLLKILWSKESWNRHTPSFHLSEIPLFNDHIDNMYQMKPEYLHIQRVYAACLHHHQLSLGRHLLRQRCSPMSQNQTTHVCITVLSSATLNLPAACRNKLIFCVHLNEMHTCKFTTWKLPCEGFIFVLSYCIVLFIKTEGNANWEIYFCSSI